ncbi:hypothetical protein ACJZ2D_002335 [Fusarium nematophilum]
MKETETECVTSSGGIRQEEVLSRIRTRGVTGIASFGNEMMNALIPGGSMSSTQPTGPGSQPGLGWSNAASHSSIAANTHSGGENLVIRQSTGASQAGSERSRKRQVDDEWLSSDM